VPVIPISPPKSNLAPPPPLIRGLRSRFRRGDRACSVVLGTELGFSAPIGSAVQSFGGRFEFLLQVEGTLGRWVVRAR
jgi:hypothetical protein